MTLDEYWAEVGRRFRAYKHARDPWRFGQAAFNVLAEVRPDVSERVRGTTLDPFYCERMEDTTVVAFSEFVEKNW